MKKLILTLSLLAFTFWAEAREPRLIDREKDQELISGLGFNEPGQNDRFNLLLVAYDSPGSPRVRAHSRFGTTDNGRRRPGMDSRSDIMLVLSFNKQERAIDILSVGRDMEPSPSCWHRAPNHLRNRSYKGDTKINGVVNLYSRAMMVHCIRSVMGESLNNQSMGEEFEVSSGLLPIHGLFEVERGTSADSGIIGQMKDLLFGNVLSTIAIGFAYSDVADTLKNFSGRYKIIFNGLKRRDYAHSGSYQRAFNNAKFVSDALAWSARGVQTSSDAGYDFLEKDLFEPLNNVMGTTLTIAELNQMVSYYPSAGGPAQDNIFRYAGFTENPYPADQESIHNVYFQRGLGDNATNPFNHSDPVSPVRIIQIGSTTRSVAIYEDGVLDLRPAQGDYFARHLKVRPVFQKPGETLPICEDCHIQPDLAVDGYWGSPSGTLP